MEMPVLAGVVGEQGAADVGGQDAGDAGVVASREGQRVGVGAGAIVVVGDGNGVGR